MALSDSEPCSVCGRYKNRRVAIDAIIIRDDKILLIKRAVEPFKGFWALPGGGVDFDETAEDAVRKEVWEEVGLKVTSTNFLNIYTAPERDPNQVIALAYFVETEGEPKAGSDAQECEFFSLNHFPEPMALDHKKIIQNYLEKIS